MTEGIGSRSEANITASTQVKDAGTTVQYSSRPCGHTIGCRRQKRFRPPSFHFLVLEEGQRQFFRQVQYHNDNETYEDPEKAATEPTEAMTTAAENFIFLVLRGLRRLRQQ
jgi:hypothetical protein